MKKYLFRAALYGIAAAILAACQSKSIQTFPQPDTSVINGPDRPVGIPTPPERRSEAEGPSIPLYRTCPCPTGRRRISPKACNPSASAAPI